MQRGQNASGTHPGTSKNYQKHLHPFVLLPSSENPTKSVPDPSRPPPRNAPAPLPRPRQDASGRSQDAPRRPQMRQDVPPDASKTRPEASTMPLEVSNAPPNMPRFSKRARTLPGHPPGLGLPKDFPNSTCQIDIQVDVGLISELVPAKSCPKAPPSCPPTLSPTACQILQILASSFLSRGSPRRRPQSVSDEAGPSRGRRCGPPRGRPR